MGKPNSETLLGVAIIGPNGLTVDSSGARAAGTVEETPKAPDNEALSSLVDTRRGVALRYRAGEAPESTMAHTQPGVGAAAEPVASRRSGTHVRVSTQNGSSLPPPALGERGTSAPPTERRGAAELEAGRSRNVDSRGREIPHDTLRGVGAEDLANLNRTLALGVEHASSRFPPTTKPRATSNDVVTSALNTTLPIGTRLPASLMPNPSEGPRVRGFATQPPVTPKVYTASGMLPSERVDTTAPTVEIAAFRSSNDPYSDSSGSDRITADELPSARSPRERTKTLEVAVTSPIAVRAASAATTSTSVHLSTTPRTTEETFRPSAHTTPPGPTAGTRRRVPALPVLAGAAVALIGIGAFAVRVDVSHAAQGAVMLEGGTTPVINRIAGPVTRVLVKPGDAVSAGQTVVEIEASALDERRSELREREAALLAQQARIDGAGNKLHTAATEALQRKRGVLWERLKLRKTNSDAEKSLRDVQARDALLLIRQELADVEFELNRRQSDRSNQEQSIQERLSEVRLELAQLAAQSPAVTAPLAGRVDVVFARPGEVLNAGAAVAQITPEGATWTAALLVPKTVSPSLSVGAEVPLRVESGTGHVNRARVTRIGDTHVSREEAAALVTAPVVEPMVRIDLEVIDPTDAGLRSGAPVRAELPGGTRSLWQHLWSNR